MNAGKRIGKAGARLLLGVSLCLAAVSSAWGELVQVEQVSSPIGFLSQTTAVEVGENVVTLTPALSKDGYAFGYWTAGATRLSDDGGRSLTTGVVKVEGTLTLTAHYFPENEDSDGDGIRDWFEYRHFGDLGQTLSADPDSDGFTNGQEDGLGQEPTIADLVEDGGISFASAGMATFADTSLIKYAIRSEPIGFVSGQTAYAELGSKVTTASLHGETNGYHFSYWTVNGTRQASPTGVAGSLASFTLNGTTEVVAHYLPSAEDADADGIMDWFELNQFGNLAQGPDGDPDGDSFTNARESALGQEALVKDLVEDGGVSFSASALVSYASDDMVNYVIKSDPVGFVTTQEASSNLNSLVTTANLHGETNGYQFAYWTVNGVRQASPTGVSLSQASFRLTETTEAIARYLPKDEDSDGDGVMDWFELNQFGNLAQGPEGDPDGDSFTNEQEGVLGQEARIKDLVEDGGISFASSKTAFYFVQSYDRLDGLELNGTTVYAYSAAGQRVGTFTAFDHKDPEGTGEYRFELVTGSGDADNAKFRINGRKLETNAFLLVGSYSIRVRATNSLNVSIEKPFVITALPQPEAPNSPPVITSDEGGDSAELSVRENESEVTIVTATDPDEDSLSYSIAGGEDFAKFSIDASTGALIFRAPPDFEKPTDSDSNNTYEVLVSVSDGELSDKQLIQVSVSDVIELSGISEFTLHPASIKENLPAGSIVGTFSILLKDGTRRMGVTNRRASTTAASGVSYAFVSGKGDVGNALFAISGKTLSAKGSFDFESGSSHSIRVLAKTSEGMELEKVFLVQIEDVFENTPPTFTLNDGKDSAALEVAENQKAVAKITADDPDDQALAYFISGGADESRFIISSATGLLSFADNPDFENPVDTGADNVYEIVVLVSDGIDTDSQTLRVTVTDDENEDTDKDGLSDLLEKQIGTDPNNPDSDGDGFSDGAERNAKTNPLDPDDYPGVVKDFDFSTLESIAENDDDEDQTSKIEFSVVEGETYYLAVDGAKDEKGLAVLNYLFDSGLSGSSESASFESSGESINLSTLTADSLSGSKRINWIAEDDGFASLQAAGEALGTSLKVYAENEYGNLKLVSGGPSMEDSEELARTTFEVKEGERYVIEVMDLATEPGQNARLDLNLAPKGAGPPNDDFAKRVGLRGDQVKVTSSLVGATSELGEPMHADLSPPQKSVWWKWMAPSDGSLKIQVAATDFESKLALYAGWQVDDLILVASNANAPAGSTNVSIETEVRQGVEYAIAVSGYGGDQGALALDLTFNSSGVRQSPTNDDFQSGKFVFEQDGRVTGGNDFASAEINEPEHGAHASPTNSIWWKWLAADSGKATVDTHGSDFDTVLAVYQGSSVQELSLVQSNDDHEETSTSQLSFDAQAGETYAIAVDGFENTTGQVVLNLKLVPAAVQTPSNDKIENAREITDFSQPVAGSNRGATGKANEPSHTAESRPLASVWWKWVSDRSSFVGFDTLGSSFDTTIAIYTKDEGGNLVTVASNDDFFGTTSLVWFKPSIGETYYLAVDGKKNGEGLIVLNPKAFGDQENIDSSFIQGVYSSSGSTGDASNKVLLKPSGVELVGSGVQYQLANYEPQANYKVWKWQAEKWDEAEGAEITDGLKVETDGSLPGIQGLIRHSGSKAFCLQVGSQESSSLFFERWLYATEESSINWWEYLQDSNNDYSAKLEYSLDGEITWNSLFESRSTPSFGFVEQEASLAELAGKIVKIRFYLTRKNPQNAISGSSGWYLDDIQFKNSYYLVKPQSYDSKQNTVEVSFTDSSLHLLFTEKIGAPPTGRYSKPLSVLPGLPSAALGFLGGEEQGNPGWRLSDWYGYYYLPANSYWFYSLNLGWQYFGQTTIGGGWLFDPELKWLWTSSNIYPWLYQHSRQQWIYDYSTPSEKRIFYDPSTKSRME